MGRLPSDKKLDLNNCTLDVVDIMELSEYTSVIFLFIYIYIYIHTNMHQLSSLEALQESTLYL